MKVGLHGRAGQFRARIDESKGPGTTTNWDKATAEDKNLAGVKIVVQ